MRVREVRRGHGPRRDQHALADPAAEDVEGDEPLTTSLGASVDLHLEEGAVGQPLDLLGRPHAADHSRLQHQRSFSISTPNDRALSLANGVSTAPRPSTSRLPSAAALATARSVTAPRSMRTTLLGG